MPITAQDLREILHEHAATGPSHPVRRAQIHARIRRTRRRRTIGAGAAGLAVVVAVALAVGLLPGLRGDRNTAASGHTTATLIPSTVGGRPTAAQLNAASLTILHRFEAADLPTPAGIRTQANGSLLLSITGHVPVDQLRELTAPGFLQFRTVLAITEDVPNARIYQPEAPGDPLPTLADVVAKVGQDRYNQAASLTDTPPPGAHPETTFAAFGTLTPAEVAVLPANIQFYVPTVTCAQLDARDPTYLIGENYLPTHVVACGTAPTDQDTKYLLDVASVGSSDIAGATATYDLPNEGGWYVEIDFTGNGQARWTALTAAQVGNQIGLLLDGKVISAPQIKEAINGPAIINGTGINETTARLIANLLTGGALPVTFTLSDYSSGP